MESINGWNKKTRKLAKLWMGQLVVNKKHHNRYSNFYGGWSNRAVVISAILLGVASLFSFLNAALSQAERVNTGTILAFSIVAGVCTAIVGVISAIKDGLAINKAAEQHRTTAVQYSRAANELQCVLVEEDESKLPLAQDILSKVSETVFLLQVFGPGLGEENNDISDLPAMMGASMIKSAKKHGHDSGPAGSDIFEKDSASDYEQHIQNVIDDEKKLKLELEKIASQQKKIDDLKSKLHADVDCVATSEESQDNILVDRSRSYGQPDLRINMTDQKSHTKRDVRQSIADELRLAEKKLNENIINTARSIEGTLSSVSAENIADTSKNVRKKESESIWPLSLLRKPARESTHTVVGRENAEKIRAIENVVGELTSDDESE